MGRGQAIAADLSEREVIVAHLARLERTTDAPTIAGRTAQRSSSRELPRLGQEAEGAMTS